MSGLENLENGLQAYYDQLSTPYDGLFAAFVEDNGFDEEDIKGEMESTANECTILEFHDYFPLKPEIDDQTARNEEIFRIMKHCYDNGEPPNREMKAKPFDINLLKISKQDVTNAEKLYR
eukprot:338734_1